VPTNARLLSPNFCCQATFKHTKSDLFGITKCHLASSKLVLNLLQPYPLFVTHIKRQKLISSTQVRGYNTRFLLHPRPWVDDINATNNDGSYTLL